MREETENTPSEHALYLTLLTVQVVGAIQQAYTNGKMDLGTYNHLYKSAREADGQARKLHEMLEKAEEASRPKSSHDDEVRDNLADWLRDQREGDEQ
jgi:hypothetical protein